LGAWGGGGIGGDRIEQRAWREAWRQGAERNSWGLGDVKPPVGSCADWGWKKRGVLEAKGNHRAIGHGPGEVQREKRAATGLFYPTLWAIDFVFWVKSKVHSGSRKKGGAGRGLPMKKKNWAGFLCVFWKSGGLPKVLYYGRKPGFAFLPGRFCRLSWGRFSGTL